jgi:tRNA threonylcarbamoyladenosine modification (KEOPS) complex  Pcc1 subunit
MPAAKLNLLVEQGATFSKRLVWRDKNKRPVNLSSYTAKMQVRATVASSDVIYELSTANGRITLSSAGVIQLDISAADTSTLKAGVYDLELTASGGQVYRLVEGKLTVSPEVTR